MTPHFRIDEAISSTTADRQGINNMPTPEHASNILATALCMEQVRAFLGHRAITVMSWYRSPVLNRAVGGTPTSAHALGFAVDFTVAGYTPWVVCRKLAESPLVFDQLIYEPSRGITHISFEPRLRRQILTQRGGPGSPIAQGIVR